MTLEVLPGYRLTTAPYVAPPRRALSRPFDRYAGNMADRDPELRASRLSKKKQAAVTEEMVDVACEAIRMDVEFDFYGGNGTPPSRKTVRAALLLALEESRLQEVALALRQRKTKGRD